MQETANELIVRRHRTATSHQELRVGSIVDISEDGKLVVDYAGNECGPVQARCLRSDCLAVKYEIGSTVLLVFEKNDLQNPIVLGVVTDSCCRSGDLTRATVDDRQVILRANKEILLECGQSSVLLRNDGKIIIRGVEIVSRASRANKIRGACVKIN